MLRIRRNDGLEYANDLVDPEEGRRNANRPLFDFRPNRLGLPTAVDVNPERAQELVRPAVAGAVAGLAMAGVGMVTASIRHTWSETTASQQRHAQERVDERYRQAMQRATDRGIERPTQTQLSAIQEEIKKEEEQENPASRCTIS